jgi:prolyl-tRNA synthetase
MSLAPYHAIIIPIKYDGAVRDAADRLAKELEGLGVETLIDDRDERPGVKFKDADLTGIPFRVVAADKNLAEGKLEIKRRGAGESRLVETGRAAAELAALVQAELAALNG